MDWKARVSVVVFCSFCVLTPARAQEGAGDAADKSKGKGEAAAAKASGEGQGEAKNAPDKGPSAAITEGTEDPSASAPTTGGYVVQLKQLEQRVNELKERIFRSKARLNLLKETVLHGVIAGSRTIIRHKNDMGSSFRLVKLIYAVDGAQIYFKQDDSGALNDKKEFDVFSGSIVPGNHTLSVQMIYRGHGYGIFSYLKGYKFTLRSSHTFTAGEGRQTIVTVNAYEKGNITTELQDRPAIKFDVKLFSGSSRELSGGGK